MVLYFAERLIRFCRSYQKVKIIKVRSQISGSTIHKNTIQYNTIQYNTIQNNTIQYNTMQCNAMQCNTYLLLAECKVRTASYGPGFFLPFYGPGAKRAGHETRKEKSRIHNLLYGPGKRG